MKSLEQLDAGGCRLNDDSLAPLRESKNLYRLNVPENPLTDDCLRHIAAIESLRFVSLAGTQVTEEGLRKLHELRPELWIDILPGEDDLE